LSSEIWVCGEVLIDLIPSGTQRIPIVGGGPANTAKALSKLGFDACFIDGISTDSYGQMVRKELLADGVNIKYSKMIEKPTALAVVTLSEFGSATYEFLLKDTATFDFQTSWLPDSKSNPPSLLHIGTLATVVEPAASTLFKWASEVSKKSIIVFDPNVRPAVISDRDNYKKAVERWLSISDVVKMSIEDANWLYPGKNLNEITKEWLSSKTKLIVVTKGEDGISAFTSDESFEVPAVKVSVSDTVGAGDTVGAIVVEAIVEIGLDNLKGEKLQSMLSRATKAAAITVSRSGAKPPTKNEII
jgi:fructokinase